MIKSILVKNKVAAATEKSNEKDSFMKIQKLLKNDRFFYINYKKQADYLAYFVFFCEIP